MALTSGVANGLTAGATLYIDSNDVTNQVNVTPNWYTWLDEGADNAAAVEPVYGLALNGGYTYALSDDMSVGATGTLCLYDLLGGSSMANAFSIAPSFSGLGAKVSGEFDYGLGGLMYGKGSASYTIMGLTPSVTFHYVVNTSDYVLAYASTPTSVLAKVKNSGGMAVEGGLSADLSKFVPVPVTVSGGATYGMPEGADKVLAWNGGVSVVPAKDLTLSANASADAVAGSTFNYSLGASYAYSSATISAAFTNTYNSTLVRDVKGWSLGAKVSF